MFAYRMELYVNEHGYAATCNMAVRREVFDVVGDFAGIELAEDRDWGHRAGRLDFQIDYAPQVVVSTPARADLAELARKIDRQVAHDRRCLAPQLPRLRWTARALAMPLSPLAEVTTVARSGRIRGLSERARAWCVLVWARAYKGYRMLCLVRRRWSVADGGDDLSSGARTRTPPTDSTDWSWPCRTHK
ncbi:MAG: hypothetical protein U5R31_15635 [Acidimicrobiia bacterium]|nr:hypothetical protein [Acidimicrobiia bacterium]